MDNCMIQVHWYC